jgi:hypothetical protein
MTQYTPPVTRKPTKWGHYYTDANNNRMPGVTTILNAGINKPQLIDWAGNKTVEIAIDHWDELTDMPPIKRSAAITSMRKTSENLVKNRGTRVHAIAANIVAGQPATFEGDDEEQLLRPYIENYIHFIDLWALDPVLVECVVVNYSIGFAGTLDLIAELTTPAGDRERWLLDIKTGEKGIWPETALQLAAYRNAERYVDNHGDEQPMPTVDQCGAIHVTADDAILVPTFSGAQAFKMFRHAKIMYEFDKDKDGYILPALLHPKTSAAHIDWGRQ